MSGAAIAAGLLLATLAFALGFVGRREALVCNALAAAAAMIAAMVSAQVEVAFAGTWASLIAAAGAVYFPRIAQHSRWVCPAFALNAGGWAGLLAVHEPGGSGVVAVLPALLLAIPAVLLVERGWGIALRVATSWLLAVALLVGSIPYLVDHPGYVPDHRV
jgi:hypothetical protein